MKISIIKLLLISSATFMSAQGHVPFAATSHLPEKLDYFFMSGYGAESQLESTSYTASIVIGEPVVSAPVDAAHALTSNNYTAAFGYFSYLLNVPDKPIVEAGDAVSGEVIDVTWKMDVNSPPATGEGEHSINSEFQEGSLYPNTWKMKRRTRAASGDGFDSNPVYYPAQTYDNLILSDGSQMSQPEINSVYNYGIISSNFYGHSQIGEDDGFRISNARFSGQVRSISHVTPGNPHNEAQPGPPVQRAEVILTPGTFRPTTAYPIGDESDLSQYGNTEGKAVYLDGSNDYMVSETNLSKWFNDDSPIEGFLPNENFTFEMWFKPQSENLFVYPTEEEEYVLVDMGEESDDGGLKIVLQSQITTGGLYASLMIHYRGFTQYFLPLNSQSGLYTDLDQTEPFYGPTHNGDSGGPYFGGWGDEPIEHFRGWYHIAVVYNGNYFKTIIYSKEHERVVGFDFDEWENDPPHFIEGDMYFGRDRDNHSHFNGWIDEIRFWRTARSSYDIGKNRNRSLQITDSGRSGPDAYVDDLIAYWKMDDGFGTTAYDMADLDAGSFDVKDKLYLRDGAEFNQDETQHSNVRLSAYTNGEGAFDLRNIPYSPSNGTSYMPTVYKPAHTDFQGSDFVQIDFSNANAHHDGTYIWDHSTETVTGKVTYDETTYGIEDVEIMIQYGHIDGGNFVVGDPTYPDPSHPRYLGTVMRTEPRTFTDENGNYLLHVEPEANIRLFAYYGGHWETNEPTIGAGFDDIDEDGIQDNCGALDIDQDGYCYKDRDTIFAEGGTSLLYQELRNVTTALSNKNFSNQQKDQVHIKIRGGLCDYSVGDFKVLIDANSSFDQTGVYYKRVIFNDNDETYNLASQSYEVPPIPLFFRVSHCGEWDSSEESCSGNNSLITNNTKSISNPAATSNIIQLDLRDGPNSTLASAEHLNESGDYISNYDIEWLFRNPDIEIEIVDDAENNRDAFYTIGAGSHLDSWNDQVGDDGVAGTEDDNPLPESWGLSASLSNSSVNIYDEPVNDYGDTDYIYIRQGGFDPTYSADPVQELRKNVYIFPQEITLFTEFFVYSDYSDFNGTEDSKCGCDNFTIDINNNVAGVTMSLSGHIEEGREKGKVFHSFTTSKANTSNDKKMTIYASAVDYSGPEGAPRRPPQSDGNAHISNDDIIVTGANIPAELEGSFDVNEETNPIPFFILRDPPGDESFSFIEQGRTFCKEYSFSFIDEDDDGESLLAMLGVDVTTEAGTALGAFFGMELEIDATLDFSEQWGVNNTKTSTETNVLCWTAQQTFSTSDVEAHSPLLSDLYVGSGMVLNIGVANQLELDDNNAEDRCGADVDDPCLYIARVPLTGPESFPSQFIYSEWAIVNDILPEIYNTILTSNPGGTSTILDHALWWEVSRRSEIWFLYGPEGGNHKGINLDPDLAEDLQVTGYLIPPLRVPDANGSAVDAEIFNDKVRLYNHWVSYVQRNQTLKASAVAPESGEIFMSYQDAATELTGDLAGTQSEQSQTDYLMGETDGSAFPEGWHNDIFSGQNGVETNLEGLTNQSFTGGVSYLYEFENTAEFSNSIAFSLENFRETLNEYGLEVSGVGDIYGSMTYESTNAENSLSNTDEESRKIGIYLHDNDLDDLFQVEIKVDDDGLPVYKTTSGRSSNPYEPTTGTVRVQKAELEIVGDFQAQGLDPADEAVFTFNLINASETVPETPDYYTFFLDPASNPGGAVISGAAGVQTDGVEYFLQPGTPLSIDIGVSRGPADYDYNDLKFYVSPIFENEIAGDWQIFNYTNAATTTADSWLQVPDPQNSDNKTIDVSFTQPCIDLYFDIIPYDDVPAPAVEGFDLVINHEFYEAHTTLGFEMDDVDLLGEDEIYGSEDDFLSSFFLEYNVTGTIGSDGNAIEWVSIDETMHRIKHDDPETGEINESHWNTTESYSLGDIVKNSSSYYRCITNHTASTFADDVGNWEVIDIENQIEFEWTLPEDDNGYVVRVTSTCENTERASSDSKRIYIDKTGPRIVTLFPVDGVLGPQDQIKVVFDEEIQCLPGTDNSFIEDSDPSLFEHDIVPSTQTCTEDELYIYIANGVAPWKIENHTLQVHLGGEIEIEGMDNIQVVSIKDRFGNTLIDEGGTELEETSFPVLFDKNPIRWSVDNLQEVMYMNETNSFSVPIINTATVSTDFKFGETIGPSPSHEIPWWITPSPMEGTINAGGEELIELTIDPELPMGVHEGYLFAEAMEGDERLHFTVEMLCAPPDWQIDPTDFEYSMNIVSIVKYIPQTTHVLVEGNHNLLVAMMNGEVVGMAQVGNTPYVTINEDGTPNPRNARTAMTIYSNSLDGSIELFLWHSEFCEERRDPILTDLDGWSDNLFVSNGVYGNIVNPIQIVYQNTIARKVNINQNYTWSSFTLENDDLSLSEVFSEVSKTTDDRIISSGSYATWSGTAWSGSLTEINNTKSYTLYFQEPQVLEMYSVGSVVQGAGGEPLNSLSLNSGWNWFSYLPNDKRPLNTTVFSLSQEAETGDIIKSQTAFVTYLSASDLGGDSEEGVWLGTLSHLHPGEGYRSKLTNIATLTYQENDDGGRSMEVFNLVNNIDSLYQEYNFDPYEFEYSMNMVSIVESDTFGVNDPEDLVFIYDSEGNIRGVGKAIYLEQIDQYRMFLTVYSNNFNLEELSMRFYDTSEEIWYYCHDNIVFSSNDIIGTVLNPFVVSLNPLKLGDEGFVPETFVLDQNFPNPFNPVTTIGFGVPEASEVRVKIYNLLGQEVRQLYSGFMQPGYQYVKWDGTDHNGVLTSSGMYIVIMEAGNFIDTKKLIMLK